MATSQPPNDDLPTLFWSRKFSNTEMVFEIIITASVVSGILGVVGGVCNAIVVYIIIQIRKHQERMNVDILILSLCFSDFISSVAVQSLLIALILTPHENRTLAHLILLQIISHCTLLSGSLGLLVITLERFISIRFPFLYSNYNSEVTMYIFLVFIWSCTFLLAAWAITDAGGEAKGFPLVISVVFSLTILLQIMIFTIVHAQKRNIRRQVVAVQHNHPQSQNDTSHIASQTNANRSKTNKTILYLCIVFIATWLPSILFRLYYFISGNGSTILKWVAIFRIVMQTHSCINPFIYFLRTGRVKNALVRRFGFFFSASIAVV